MTMFGGSFSEEVERARPVAGPSTAPRTLQMYDFVYKT